MSLPNYSIYSVPAYYALTMFPHGYSIALVRGVSKKTWDNRNPRGDNQSQSIQKSVPSPIFTKYERCRACHANGMENMPLFLAAVILGNMAGLDKDVLNWSCGAFLGLRALYTVAYIQIESRKMSFARTLLWNVSVGVCMRLILKAGKVFAEK